MNRDKGTNDCPKQRRPLRSAAKRAFILGVPLANEAPNTESSSLPGPALGNKLDNYLDFALVVSPGNKNPSITRRCIHTPAQRHLVGSHISGRNMPGGELY